MAELIEQARAYWMRYSRGETGGENLIDALCGFHLEQLESREPAAQPESPKCGACGRSGHWGDCGAAQGEWIAVTERLPEMFDSLADEGIYWSTSVLVADGPALDLAKYHTGKHGNKWIAESGSEMEVDYWMPLPAAPEEK
jgi:hypothetical protein